MITCHTAARQLPYSPEYHNMYIYNDIYKKLFVYNYNCHMMSCTYINKCLKCSITDKIVYPVIFVHTYM